MLVKATLIYRQLVIGSNQQQLQKQIHQNQVLLMKINFDRITTKQQACDQNGKNRQSPIKIQIQSPVYSQFVRELNPDNYKSQIVDIKKLLCLPNEASKFIEQQVSKQINSSAFCDYQQQNEYLQKSASLKLKQANIQKRPYFANDRKHLTEKRNCKGKEQRRKQKETAGVKKHKCMDQIITQAKTALQQMDQLTGHPYLYPSEITKRTQCTRKFSKNNGEVYSVHENLYHQASKRRVKLQMKKQQALESWQNAMKQKKLNKNKSNRMSYASIYNRINKILQARENKRKQKQQIDQTNNKKMFEPDLHLSRESYRIYANSLSKQKIKKSPEAKKNGKIEKKQSKVQIDQSKWLYTSRYKQNTIDTKTIQYFTEVFYPSNESASISLRTSAASNPINKQQFLVLQNFLHEIEQLQSKKYEMETTISSAKASTSQQFKSVLAKKEFQQKFKKYYEKLCLHDRQILRKQVVNSKKIHNKNIEQHNFTPTFKPTINARSNSLDNLAKGHIKDIYYV